MPRTKKVNKPEEVFEGLGNFKELAKAPERPVITSITINPNGTIFGLSDNKIYRYDDVKKVWVS
jgi:hypothetical protein